MYAECIKRDARIQSSRYTMPAPHNVTECQIFLTRRCNLLCGYCKLTKRHFERELSVAEWKSAFSNMEKIGIKTVKILGGEPTVVEGIEELIRFLNEETSLKYSISSNSMFGDEKFESLISAGIRGYFASIDGIENIKSVDEYGARKSGAGFRRLLDFKKKGVRMLGANVVINRQNVSDMPEIAKALSDDGIWVNLCPVIHGKDDFWEFRTDVPSQYRFTKADVPMIDASMKELVALKRRGCRIAVSDSYLLNMSKYCIDLSWKCLELSQLRVDADGSLTICNDLRGKIAGRYNILRMDNEIFGKFRTEWLDDRERLNCAGCYWSCFVNAQDNMENSRREFAYFGK